MTSGDNMLNSGPMKLRLRQIRTERGLTLVQLSDMAAMSVSYLSDLETGKRQINARRLEALAKALRVAPTDLIDDPGLSSEVQKHLDILRQLSPQDQEAVMRVARGLLAGRE